MVSGTLQLILLNVAVLVARMENGRGADFGSEMVIIENTVFFECPGMRSTVADAVVKWPSLCTHYSPLQKKTVSNGLTRC